MRANFVNNRLVHSFGQLCSLENFSVRRLTAAEDVRDLIAVRVAAQGRKPGALDHLSYFSADKSGFFVGELNGKVVCCMSAVKFSKEYAFVGNYVVDKPYRGRGYGRAIKRTTIASLSLECNFAGDTYEKNVALFEKRFGYKLAWRYNRVNVMASVASTALSGFSHPSSVTIQNANDIPFSHLVKYDTSVHIHARPYFLEKWLYAPNCHSYVATASSGSVVGYAVVRTTLRPEDGWRVNPLYADSYRIARSLYRAIFNKVSSIDPSALVTADVPCLNQCNPEAVQLADEFSSSTDETLARIYRYQVPSYLPLHKVFGL
jgi:hypothetical protein